MEVKNLPEELRGVICAIEYQTIADLVSKAADEIERLRAIVNKLPKCWRLNEQGELVQDEPILSGMNAVTICKKTDSYISIQNIYEEVGVISVEAYEGGGFDIVIRDSDGNEWYLKEQELYLTREAAEAAREK